MKLSALTDCWRLFLTGVVVLFAILLLGADYPEHETQKHTSVKVAGELCREIAPELRNGLEKAAAQNPVWIIQTIVD